ncbi:low molecular weight phosphatase family protein [uncultured Rhodoblastus sp.]|uniref:arsenate-mycothiol transferase ArsC n=1 Tax=uncultured Rhodoblastus sp. TaxID=543037 RepID=UPI0025CEF560|nr:low molecular weight phosphatase family protein [uncultured Rhodoblastus sp.]
MASGSLPRAVLYACTQNSIRSPMAAALTRFLFGKSMEVASVGSRAGEPDGFAMAVMQEAGIDLSRHVPKIFEDLDNFDFDLIVALSPEAHRRALEIFRDRRIPVEFWPTPDATDVDGAREQKLEAYRAVRDGLLQRIELRFDVRPLGAG